MLDCKNKEVLIFIYSNFESTRLKYVLEHVFSKCFKLNYQLVHDFENHEISINYSHLSIKSNIQIVPNELLKETNIQEQTNSQIYLEKELKLNDNKRLNFDLFSSVFFHLSRYEEYISKSTDEHNRYLYSESILYKNNIIDFPIVDAWIQQFSQLIKNELNIELKLLPSVIKPSIDIDSVYAYKGRGLLRQILGFGNSLIHLNFYEFLKRLKVLINLENDPNDNFEYQFLQLKQHHLFANYFIQVGEYGKYDKNININNKDFRNVILEIEKQGHIVGLHPSFQSYLNENVIKNELKSLVSTIKHEVYHSRQHFLRFKLPQSFQDLHNLGIKYEYSMGYSEINGFRAGTGSSFYWFNLNKNEATNLLIVPFVWMDVACKNFLNMSHFEAEQEVLKYKKICRENNIDFSFVYHNESLSEHRGWENWRKVFELCLKSNI